MFDMHYDLLTMIYMCYKQNSLYKIENIVKNYHFGNVRGLIANLCFMSIDEMKEDYDENYFDTSVMEIFRTSVSILKQYLPKDILFLTSIEGRDYLDDENDLIILKELGLNSIVPVWNNKNKFGSGNRSNDGLTEMGKRLIVKAIELGIGIDLSHANEKTFFDIIEVVKEQIQKGMNPVVYASHSNVRSFSRNLTDKQILALKSVDGVIGLVAHSNFTLNGSLKKRLSLKGKEYDDFLNIVKVTYIKHIMYVNKLLGDTENIALSTDDMTFVETNSDYEECPIFDYRTIGTALRTLLSSYYSRDIVNNIMFNNACKIYEKLTQVKIKTK